MTIDDFHSYISVLNDRLSAHWKFMNQNHPDQWPLEMNRDKWAEQFIDFIYYDQQEEYND